MPDPISVQSAITVVTQGASHIDTAVNASADLHFSWPTHTGQWHWYIEGSSSISRNSVAARLPEANADAGSALDADGDGRLQLSTLHYIRRLGDQRWLSVGLIDPSAILDASDIANDENTQFLGSSFKNNPLIGFPDYTPGFAVRLGGLQAMLTSSNGLADNPERSYSELLDTGAAGKSVFAALEHSWSLSSSKLTLGAWHNGARFPRLANPLQTSTNFGAYLNADIAAPGAALNVRAGFADSRVSRANRFMAIAATREHAGLRYGAGVGWWHAARDAAGSDTTQVEIFVAIPAGPRLVFTPSVQFVSSSDLGAADTGSSWVVGLRLHATN